MTKYFDDHVIGEKMRFGSYHVTREEVIEFASKYDPKPFHIDDEAAANSHFGRLVASGWHTAAIMSRIQVDMAVATGADGATIAGAGVDSLRWLKPVYPGDVLEAENEVIDKVESHTKLDRGILRSRLTLYNQNGEVVMTMIASAMTKRRPLAE